jgi:hypothetical protein
LVLASGQNRCQQLHRDGHDHARSHAVAVQVLCLQRRVGHARALQHQHVRRARSLQARREAACVCERDWLERGQQDVERHAQNLQMRRGVEEHRRDERQQMVLVDQHQLQQPVDAALLLQHMQCNLEHAQQQLNVKQHDPVQQRARGERAHTLCP